MAPRHDEQPVHPRADDHQVGGLDGAVVGPAERADIGDPVPGFLQLGGDELTGLAGVARETLEQYDGLHAPE